MLLLLCCRSAAQVSQAADWKSGTQRLSSRAAKGLQNECVSQAVISVPPQLQVVIRVPPLAGCGNSCSDAAGVSNCLRMLAVGKVVNRYCHCCWEAAAAVEQPPPQPCCCHCCCCCCCHMRVWCVHGHTCCCCCCCCWGHIRMWCQFGGNVPQTCMSEPPASLAAAAAPAAASAAAASAAAASAAAAFGSCCTAVPSRCPRWSAAAAALMPPLLSALTRPSASAGCGCGCAPHMFPHAFLRYLLLLLRYQLLLLLLLLLQALAVTVWLLCSSW